MAEHIDTTIPPVKTEIDLRPLAETVRRCHQQVVTAALNILDGAMAAGDALIAIEASRKVRHGEWETWIPRNCGINPRTARRYMQLARARSVIESKRSCATDLSIAAALKLIAVKKEKGVDESLKPEECAGTTETDGPAEPADDAAASVDRRKALYAAIDGDHADDHAGGEDHDHADGGDGHVKEPEPAPDPAAIAAAAVNQLNPAELQSFLDQLSPEHKRSFEHRFGTRDSDSANTEIATLAGECSALLAHAAQNTDEIRKKLARIKKLTGVDGKARAKIAKSNAQLDRGAFARGMGLAGQPGKKFPTMSMEPTGADASGNSIFAQSRGNGSRPH